VILSDRQGGTNEKAKPRIYNNARKVVRTKLFCLFVWKNAKHTKQKFRQNIVNQLFG